MERVEQPGTIATQPPESWSRLRLGLRLTYLGVTILFVASLLLVLLVLAPVLLRSGAGRGAGQFTVTALLLRGGVCILLSAGLLALAGEAILCTVPVAWGLRGWAFGAAALGVCGRLFALVAVAAAIAAYRSALAPPADDFGPGDVPLDQLGSFVWLLATVAVGVAALGEVVLLSLTLRALAMTLGDDKLARRAADYARFFVTFTIPMTALNVLAGPALPILFPSLSANKEIWSTLNVLWIAELIALQILLGQLCGLVGDTRDAVALARESSSGRGR
jgi:hypothetical protein